MYIAYDLRKMCIYYRRCTREKTTINYLSINTAYVPLQVIFVPVDKVYILILISKYIN